ncbi:hypothetical protein M422DRAFT_188952, partial [Sphaerobolus stellatus SS14]
DAAPAADTAAAGTSTGKYVPPSMRSGAGRGAGESMFRSRCVYRSITFYLLIYLCRDDLPTLRVTNVSEDASDNDLRELFSVCGRVARVYIGKDRETGIGKGYAFISFEDRAAAQKAIEKMNGRGYDNLILNVAWSRKYSLIDICWAVTYAFSFFVEPREQRPGA